MQNQLFVQILTLLVATGLAGLEASKQAASATDDASHIAINVAAVAKDDLSMSLRFEPPELDFGLWSVGIARSHQVTLVNENVNHSVHLSSVSGGTSIFFASFMDTRVIAPLSNTTFDVVFLPRKSVLATDTLLVHTSFGQARLLVRGRGFECPYRLKPLVGIKAPLNAMLTPEIYMYNPHERPLQIIEIYSSGGQFQLELPSGLSSAPQALWEIPPYTTKPIIRIKFHGNSAGNHSAFIRIKIAAPTPTTNDEGKSDVEGSQPHMNTEDVLVVPVEFEIVGEHGGVYASNPVLDFGRLTNVKPKKPIHLSMNLKNSIGEHTDKEEQQDADEAKDKSFSVFLKTTLPSGFKFEPNNGGSLILDALAFNKTTIIDELITLESSYKDKSREGNLFTIRIRAEIFKGTLYFDRNASVFVSDAANVRTRTLSVRNGFDGAVALQNISFDATNQKAVRFELAKDFHEQVLQPGQTYDLLHLHLKDNRTQYQSSIRIQTNITNFDLPVIVCTGRLHVTTHNEPVLEPALYNTDLNMGAVPLEEKSQDGFIALHNPNPVSVRIVNWNFKSPHGVYFETTSMGCLRPAALAALQTNKSLPIDNVNFHFCAGLGEGDIMIFRIAIQSHITDLQTATLQIWTSYETIATTVRFHTWVGRLEVEQEELYFKNCFPGKLCSSDLSIRSTFQNPIHITAINFTEDSIRFPSDDTNKKLVYALTPNAVTRLGRIYFEPSLHCHNRCYLPQDEKLNNLAFPTKTTSTTTTTTSTSMLANNNFHFDESELRRRTDLYRQMKRHFRTINFILTSRELRQVQLQAIVDIKWPKLVVDGAQKMPTIEAGKFQEHTVRIVNPADRPILVDYFLSNPKYASETKLSLPVEVVDMSMTPSCYLTDQNVFALKQPLQQHQQILLPPHASVGVVVRFDAPPQLTDTYCTLLHIRNNLTLYEAVWLSAKSVQSQFRFGNRKPGISTPLIFEVQDKHLAACQQQQPVIVKRTFTARNTGEVPIRIKSFMIGDRLCEGYGFKVIGCLGSGGGGGGFELKANESRKVEIAFRPDFTLFRLTQSFTILTNLSYEINYTLFAQLPPAEMLRDCTDVLPRPIWEKHIRIAGVLLLLTSFVLVLAAATFDADNIGNTQSALYAAREKGAIQPTFNLRNIAIKANNHQQTNANKNCKVNSNSAVNGNGSHQRHCHKTNSSNSNQQQKNVRRRAAIGNQSFQRKSSASTESTNADAQDEKFTFDFDVAGWQDSYDCGASTSSSSNSSSFKSSPSPPKSVAAAAAASTVVDKKQKIMPTTSSGKTKHSNRSHQRKLTTTTPPPKRNPIIELMDKEIDKDEKSNVVKSNSKTKAEPTLLKRITESIAAAVSIKEKPKANKTQNDKQTKSQQSTTYDDQKLTNVGPKCTENFTNEATAVVEKTQKSPELPLSTLKQRVVDISSSSTNSNAQMTIKNANYVGPIRNMETHQNQRATEPKPPKTEILDSQIQPEVKSAKSNAEPQIPTNNETANNDKMKSRGISPAENKTTIPTAIVAAPASTATVAPTVNSAVVKPLNFNNNAASSTQPQKYGKTPGRERSKEQNTHMINNNNNNNPMSNNGHLHDYKLPKQTKVIKTLNFDEPNYGCVNPNPPAPHHQNYNLEQQPIKSFVPPAASDQAALYTDLKAKHDMMKNVVGVNFNANASGLPPLPPLSSLDNSNNMMAKSISNIFKENATALAHSSHQQNQQQQAKIAELGPIGTKKSPSSTPVWEPIGGGGSAATGGNMRAPLQPKMLSGNNTFFAYPTMSSSSQAIQLENPLTNVGNKSDVCNMIDFNGAQALLDNVTASNIFELKKAQADLQRRMEANEFLLNLHQNQIKLEEERRQRQQQQQQQQEFLHSMTQWPTNVMTSQANRNAWQPSLIGYAGGGAGAIGNAGVPTMTMNFNDRADRKNSLTPPTLDQFDAWSTSSTSSNKPNAGTIRPPPGLGVAVTTPPGLGQQQQQQYQLNNNNTNMQNDGNENGLRAFDPFSSLGSIWPDSWMQAGNNQRQQQQQQPPN